MKRQEINTRFPLVVVGLVFAGIFSLFLLSSPQLFVNMLKINQEIGLYIYHNRSAYMDQLSEPVSNPYFGIPFYCALILMVAANDRIKFWRNCAAIIGFLILTGFIVFILNVILPYFLDEGCPNFVFSPCQYSKGKIVSSFISAAAALSFGLGLFFSLHLKRGFIIMKICAFIWSALVVYNLIYKGSFLPLGTFVSMITGAAAAICSNWLFKLLNGKTNNLNNEY
jgi:hypothetical protein